MERYERMVREALKAAGAQKKSQNRHEKWELPDGRCMVLAVSPSDTDFWKIKWGEVRTALGIPAKEQRKQVRERRHKRRRVRRVEAAVLSSGPKRTVGLQAVRMELMRAVKPFRPRLGCLPIERRPVYGTVVTVWLRRIFG